MAPPVPPRAATTVITTSLKVDMAPAGGFVVVGSATHQQSNEVRTESANKQVAHRKYSNLRRLKCATSAVPLVARAATISTAYALMPSDVDWKPPAVFDGGWLT